MKIRIEKLDHFVRGITFLDGKICFVEHVLPDEIVELNIIKETKKFYIGEAVDYLETSKDRVIEKCPYFIKCGGCHLEHYDYIKENEYKQEKIRELIKRFSKLNIKVDDIVFSEPNNYRNKITLHGNNHKLGYYKKESNELIEIDKCRLVDKRINDLIPILQTVAKKNEIEQVTIRVDNDSSKVMVKLEGKITNIKELNEIDVLIINNKLVTKDKEIISRIGDKKYYLSIDSFFQVNKTLTEKLYNEVRKVVEEKRPNTVLDLYCGTGTIGIYVSNYAKNVIGVDYSKTNIDDANKNKELNNLTNITFINDKVENVIDNFESNIDLIIVDPPRAGLDPKTIANLKRINPETIVYVSCDPATLARDLKELSTAYNIKYIKPFNMFPRTYHVETIVILSRKNVNRRIKDDVNVEKLKKLNKSERNGGDTMLFHVFNSQEERRDCGGSAFIEIQFCKLPSKRKANKHAALRGIHHWQNDSLYVNDENLFYNEYHNIFDTLDIFGMNYYGPESINHVIEKIIAEKPVEYEVLVEWLNKAKEYNGFYILGL